MELTGKNIIGNRLSNGNKVVFTALNASTGIKIEPGFHEASQEEIDQAVQKANEAFTAYRDKSGKEKAEFLESIADEIVALGDQLIKRCMEESGLPEARLTGERGRTVGQLKLFASLLREGSWVGARIDTADPERKPLPKVDIRSMQRALGPVGIFGASNFPLAFSVAGGDTASALAAGCTVVVKAHPAHPGTCELVGLAILNAVKKCNMPDGTFSMVQGQSTDVGMALVKHPLIKAIGFTGSYRGGKALFDEANKRPEPIPVYAEMGSTNPVFILPGALKERKDAIAQDLATSVTQGVGQFCTNPGLVFVQESTDQKEFSQSLSKNIEGVNAGVMLTAGMRNNYIKGIEKLSALNEVTILATGKQAESNFYGTAFLLQSTVKAFLKNHALEEEVFGPSTLTVTASDKTELLQAAEKLRGHLTATLIGTDEDLLGHKDLIRVLEQKVGRLLINGYPTGVEVCHSMVHGGPFPATTDSRTTSVGTGAITRFTRPLCYQNFPDSLLPDELKEKNPLNVWRLVNGETKKN